MWFITAVLVIPLGFGMAMRRKERGLPWIGAPRPIDVAGVLLSGAALASEIYLIENTNRANSGSWEWLASALLLIGFLGGGLVIGRWWATLFLPLLAIVLAYPAGENHALSEDTPWVSFIFVLLLPVWVAMVAVGVAAHKMAVRLWSSRRPRVPDGPAKSARAGQVAGVRRLRGG
jgi:hypothetical protein